MTDDPDHLPRRDTRRPAADPRDRTPDGGTWRREERARRHAPARPDKSPKTLPLDRHFGAGTTLSIVGVTAGSTLLYAWLIAEVGKPSLGASVGQIYGFLTLALMVGGWIPTAIALNILAGIRRPQGRLVGAIGGRLHFVPLFLILSGIGASQLSPRG